MNRALHIGKIWGITIRLHFSMFIFVAIITLLVYSGFPTEYHPLLRLLAGMGAGVFLFASVTAHELAHSFVALKHGIPVKSITLFFLGGVAHITEEAKEPATEFKMAVAGPLCSLTLACFFGFMWFLIWGHNEVIFDVNNLDNPVYLLVSMNLSLALFNLVPGFPLDGGRVLRALIWWKTGNYNTATRVASITGINFARLLMGGGVALLLSVFFFDESAPFMGIQFIVLGFFLHTAVSANSRQTKMRDAMQGITAQAVMSTGWIGIPPSLSISGLAQAYLMNTNHRYFVVIEERQMRGVITIDDIKKVPYGLWYSTLVKDAMTPMDKMESAHPQEEALSILQRMEQQDKNYMPVMKEGTFYGMVFRDHLIRYIQLRTEFKV